MEHRNIFELLLEKNEIPMLFIGSGLSKRYLENYPSWIELLEQAWNEAVTDDDFYAFANTIKNQLGTKEDAAFQTNIELATAIENRFNESFYEGNIQIEGFTQQDAFNSNISPFKKYISVRFSKYNHLSDMIKEIAEFKEVLLNSKIILTTNYDTFIEDILEAEQQNYEIFIGQKGFMRETDGFSEIYKLHGCEKEPNSIILTKKDYNDFDINSILISAKMISNLLNAPIIFIGYSINDRNIRNILKQFTKSLSSEELSKLRERFIVIEWEEHEQSIIEEVFFDNQLNCEFTRVKTDNYSKIYETLSKIDQGMPPSIIKKYSRVFKKLIVDRGKSGTLNSLLLSSELLEDVEKIIGNEKFVIALGDEKYVYAIPDELDYLANYFLETDDMPENVAINFISRYSHNGRIPLKKYLQAGWEDNEYLSFINKARIKNRIKKYGDIKEQIKSTHLSSSSYYEDFNKIEGLNISSNKKADLLSYNIDNLNKEHVLSYIKTTLQELIDNERKPSSQFRKLMLIYDLYFN